jgi:hypothetical protein
MSVRNDLTPPKGTRTVAEKVALPPTPTLAAVLDLLEGMAAQIEGGRTDIDDLTLTVKAIDRRIEPQVIRISAVPSPESLVPSPPAPRPSMAVKAARGTTRVGQIVMVGTGILSVTGQVIAIWKPQYAGPIIEALRLLASLGG